MTPLASSRKLCSSQQRPFAPAAAALRVCQPVVCSRGRRTQPALICRDSKADVERALKEAQSFLENLNPQASTAGSAELAAELEQAGYVCDESGCVLMFPGDEAPDANDGAHALPKKLYSGAGWSFGYKQSVVAGDVYVATVTGPDFEMGLTDTELCTFISSLRRLNEAVANLAKAGQWGPQAGDRPESRVRYEAKARWLQASYERPRKGGAPAFRLEFGAAQAGQRPIRVSWPASIVAEVLAAVGQEMSVAA